MIGWLVAYFLGRRTGRREQIRSRRAITGSDVARLQVMAIFIAVLIVIVLVAGPHSR